MRTEQTPSFSIRFFPRCVSVEGEGHFRVLSGVSDRRFDRFFQSKLPHPRVCISSSGQRTFNKPSSVTTCGHTLLKHAVTPEFQRGNSFCSPLTTLPPMSAAAPKTRFTMFVICDVIFHRPRQKLETSFVCLGRTWGGDSESLRNPHFVEEAHPCSSLQSLFFGALRE